MKALGYTLAIYSPSWTLDNGNSFVLDRTVEVLHKVKLNIVRIIIREDGKSIWG